MSKKGLFISLEGPEGAGKTTQLTLLSAKAEMMGLQVTSTREPGGTPVGDAVRDILLNPGYPELSALTEVFLYAAARAQLYQEVISPALAQGCLVLCDRFIDSSLAYQSFGGGVEMDFVLNINLTAVANRLPDRTFVLDLAPEEGFGRHLGKEADRIEKKPLQFHRQVRNGFLALADRFPARITVIDATLPVEKVFTEIWQEVEPLVRWHI